MWSIQEIMWLVLRTSQEHCTSVQYSTIKMVRGHLTRAIECSFFVQVIAASLSSRITQQLSVATTLPICKVIALRRTDCARTKPARKLRKFFDHVLRPRAGIHKTFELVLPANMPASLTVKDMSTGRNPYDINTPESTLSSS